jgi:hypothetical protein
MMAPYRVPRKTKNAFATQSYGRGQGNRRRLVRASNPKFGRVMWALADRLFTRECARMARRLKNYQIDMSYDVARTL